MKVLYAIQGTGNGHLSRAKAVIPALLNRVEVDILISGSQAEVDFPFEIKYAYKGLGFYFGKNGGIDFFKTIWKNNPFKLVKEIINCPVQKYDLVINDFEPITAWACYFKGIKSVSLSHQAVLYTENVPKPDFNNLMGKWLLKHYAKCTESYGFHFKKYNGSICSPIIRDNIRNMRIEEKEHFTVYLPAYSDKKIIKILSKINEVKWEVFSKNSKINYQIKNVLIKPINGRNFELSMASSKGVLCGAGFETPAEAIYLKKKLMVIPMKKQYEQYFNAKALQELGVPVINSLSKKHIQDIALWIESSFKVELSFPNETQHVVDHILYDYINEEEILYI